MRNPNTLIPALVLFAIGVGIGTHTFLQADSDVSSDTPRIDVPANTPYTGPKPIERPKGPGQLSGFVNNVELDRGTIYLTIDPAELFTVDNPDQSTTYTNGQQLTAAEKASLEDRGLAVPPSPVAGDSLGLISGPFYIRNNSTSTVRLVLSPTATVRVHETQAKTRTLTARQYAREFEQAKASPLGTSGRMEFSSLTHFTVRNTTITRLEGDGSP